MGKGCKRGGGSETRKTNTTGQRTHNKESMEDAMEQRNELERRTWRGRQGLQKGEDTGTEGTHRESTEDAQDRLTEDKRNNYPEEKTGQGRPKTEGKRRTPDKKTARD